VFFGAIAIEQTKIKIHLVYFMKWLHNTYSVLESKQITSVPTIIKKKFFLSQQRIKEHFFWLYPTPPNISRAGDNIGDEGWCMKIQKK
jgi:hypothetical protein